ncbi:hypothetical protein BDN72DRAFT_851384 [Pluteus cervinus]|uniref:Uncharacterized protein n=1 Tax=Pluteus cervinus TaxID=181527 RepID=A0ACD3A0X9_9AGAR|nr:hypothetical protein BDN72DRAFT_851384 [Pluteus cervinus]
MIEQAQPLLRYVVFVILLEYVLAFSPSSSTTSRSGETSPYYNLDQQPLDLQGPLIAPGGN